MEISEVLNIEKILLLFTEMQNKQAPVLQDRLQESEKLIKEMTKTWEEKLAEKDKINQVRVPADLELGYKLSPQYFNDTYQNKQFWTSSLFRSSPILS